MSSTSAPASGGSFGFNEKDDRSPDLENTLTRLSQQRDEAGIQAREVGVVFENLSVVVKGVSAAHQPSLLRMFAPSSMLESIQSVRHAQTREILSGIEGSVKPGEMLLVLGRPGAGCSTFLKTLANQRSDYHAVHGNVHYDSLSSMDVAKHYRGDVVYCPEDDIHFPTLTVAQTIKFAAKLRAPSERLGYTRNEYAEAVTEFLTALFGLDAVSNTLVGDAVIRGISGGQKKRVSIAEVMALRASIACWDNSTRGLDSSTALEFIRALRTATDVVHMTTVVSLYQAGEPLYNTFDKVCVLYEGKMAYYGPASKARDYFIDMGYEPANRQTTADFLVAITDPNGRIPRMDALSLPHTASEFASFFSTSKIADANRHEIETFMQERVGQISKAELFRDSARAEHSAYSAKFGPYVVSLILQTQAVMLRRVQILRGNMLATFVVLFSFLFQGIISGFLFLKLGEKTDSFLPRSGVLFFVLLNQAVMAMTEVPSLFSQRPIVQRQSSWAMYHPFIDQVALTIVDLPVTFLSNLILGVLMYELAQLDQSADHFFIFMLFVFVQAVVSKMWFRAITALMPDVVSAQAVAGLTTLTYIIYTGYTLPLTNMVGGLKWVSYLNPLRWSFEAVMTNEFGTVGGECVNLVPQGPGYENVSLVNQVCTTVGAVSGLASVDGAAFVELSFGFSASHMWRNFGILLAFGFAFFVALLVFTEIGTRLLVSHDIVLFKRTSSSTSRPLVGNDIESASQNTTYETNQEEPITKKAKLETISTTDIFSWHKLNYAVPTDNGPRQLLHGVSGYVAPGKLTALMGESGAGKTTLLNVLAERVDVGVITGDRFVNGHALPQDFQSQTAYCQQLDIHVPTSTVHEALLFSAQLRQPASVPFEEKLAYVETCIELCGLQSFRDAAVGSLSIENKKRTTIGVELAAKPKLLLFLDEPTSGLDSQSAWNVILFLRDLANAGQAILCTIHQPSAELFQMFDRLLLLRTGGETVYFGDLGHNALTVLSYFHANGARACQDDENPAEYMLDVIGAGATAKVEQDWHATWSASPEAVALETQLKEIHARGASYTPTVSDVNPADYTTTWMNQVVQLTKRGFSAHNREPNNLLSKVILNSVAGLFLGLSFYDSDSSQQGTQNKLFNVFMASMLALPMSSQVQIPFMAARAVYEIRERPSRMYKWTAFVTSQILVEIPFGMVAGTLFFLTWYWTVGYPTSRAAYSWLMIGVIFPTYYTTFGQAVAALTPNPEVGAMVLGLLYNFILSFNGVAQPYSNLGWWRWLYRSTPFTYFIEGVLGQAIGRQDITCSALEVVTIQPPSGETCAEYMDPYISYSGGYLTNRNAMSDCGFCSTQTTDEFLQRQFNIFYDNRWRDIYVMAAFIVFNISAIFAFMWIFRIRKSRS